MTGSGHTKHYEVKDPYLAYVVPAKIMAMSVIDLLAEDARLGLEVKATEPKMTKEEYLKLWDNFINQK